MVISHTVDLTNRFEIYTYAQIINKEFATIDYLINNAGIININPFLETLDEKIDQLIDVNLKSLFWVTIS